MGDTLDNRTLSDVGEIRISDSAHSITVREYTRGSPDSANRQFRRLNQSQRAQVKARAEELGMAVGEWMRQVMARYPDDELRDQVRRGLAE